jgi:hypothetical protein
VIGPRRLADGTIQHAFAQSGTGAASLAVTLPGTAKAGNVLVALVGNGAAASNIQTPPGWSRVSPAAGDGTVVGAVVLWKVADGTETGLTVTVGSTTTITMSLWEVEGAITGSPNPGGTSANGGASSGSTQTSGSVGAITTTRPALMLAHLHATGNLDGDAITTDGWVNGELTAANRAITGAAYQRTPGTINPSVSFSWSTARRWAAVCYAAQAGDATDLAAPVVRGSLAGNATGTTFSVTLSAHNAGDLLIVAGIARDSLGSTAPTLTYPAGWTLRHEATLGAARFFILTRRAASSSETDPSFSIDRDSLVTAGSIVVADGELEALAASTIGSSTSLPLPSVATAGRSVPIVVIGTTVSGLSTIATVNPAVYWRERHDLGTSNSSGSVSLAIEQGLPQGPPGTYRGDTFAISLSIPRQGVVLVVRKREERSSLGVGGMLTIFSRVARAAVLPGAIGQALALTARQPAGRLGTGGGLLAIGARLRETIARAVSGLTGLAPGLGDRQPAGRLRTGGLLAGIGSSLRVMGASVRTGAAIADVASTLRGPTARLITGAAVGLATAVRQATRSALLMVGAVVRKTIWVRWGAGRSRSRWASGPRDGP